MEIPEALREKDKRLLQSIDSKAPSVSNLSDLIKVSSGIIKGREPNVPILQLKSSLSRYFSWIYNDIDQLHRVIYGKLGTFEEEEIQQQNYLFVHASYSRVANLVSPESRLEVSYSRFYGNTLKALLSKERKELFHFALERIETIEQVQIASKEISESELALRALLDGWTSVNRAPQILTELLLALGQNGEIKREKALENAKKTLKEIKGENLQKVLGRITKDLRFDGYLSSLLAEALRFHPESKEVEPFWFIELLRAWGDSKIEKNQLSLSLTSYQNCNTSQSCKDWSH